MAKSVKAAMASDAQRSKDVAVSANVAGIGFTKKLSKAQLEGIKLKRAEVRSRLFAKG